jgi:hypothetical protein
MVLVEVVAVLGYGAEAETGQLLYSPKSFPAIEGQAPQPSF